MARWRRATLWVLEPVKYWERGAVGGLGQQPHIDLQVVAKGEGDLVLALGEEFVDQGQGGDEVDSGGNHLGFAGRPGREQVEIADGLTPTAERAGRRHSLDAGELAQQRTDAVGVLGGLVDAETARVAAVIFDAFQELFGELLAHARQLEQRTSLGCRFELVDVRDLECRPEQGYCLGTHAGQPQKLQHGGSIFGQQLRAQRHGAGRDEIANILCHALAYTRNGEQ